MKNYAIEIMNTCQIKEFPDSFITLDNANLMKDIFIHMAKNYLYIESDLNEICNNHSIDIKKCEEIINELNSVIIK